MLITPLALAGVCQNMVPQTDHAEWYSQDVTYKRATAEALGEAVGVELVDPAPPSRSTELANGSFDAEEIFDLLDRNLLDEHRPAAPDAYAQYRFDLLLRLSRYLRNVQAFGPAIAKQEQEDRAELLGAALGSTAGSEAKLLERIEAGNPDDDAALVAYLYRRSVREEAPWRGALGVGEGAKLQPLRL